MARPTIENKDHKKLGRKISMTKSEWEDLNKKAKEAGKSVSAYIVDRLRLK